MRNFIKAVSLAASIAFVAQSAAFAQAAPLSNAAIATQCATAAATCSDLVSAKIDALRAQGLTPDQLDAELADLVIALAEAGQTLSPAVRASIANAIRLAQAAIVNPAIRLQVAQIAAAVEAGQPIQTAALGTDASPN